MSATTSSQPRFTGVKMHKMRWRPELRPDPADGAYRAAQPQLILGEAKEREQEGEERVKGRSEGENPHQM